MKKETIQQRVDIINKSLYYIYKNIDTNITLDDLAKLNHVSKYHYHRIFKEESKENFSNTLTSIRLQKAANLIVSNTHSTITEISKACGYSSHSSFIQAFKKKFIYTPTKWRKYGYEQYSNKIIGIRFNKKIDLEGEVILMDEINCAYIRHRGYDKSIKHTWQRLRALAFELNITDYDEIGLHHDNPSIIPLDSCMYVAAITIPSNIEVKNKISTFKIPKALYIRFYQEGEFGDIINLIRYVNSQWIKDKGYEITTMPIIVKYIKNHLVDKTNYKIELNVPIKVI